MLKCVTGSLKNSYKAYSVFPDPSKSSGPADGPKGCSTPVMKILNVFVLENFT